MPFTSLPALPLSALIGVPANGPGAWSCPVCCSGGSFRIPGWLATSEQKKALARLGSDSNRQRGREMHVRREIAVLENVLRVGV